MKFIHAHGVGVGNEVTVVGVCGAGDFHIVGRQPLGAGAHIHQRAAQPQAIDADHFGRPDANSRSQVHAVAGGRARPAHLEVQRSPEQFELFVGLRIRDIYRPPSPTSA
ncbi:MAG: hypothetical protein IPG77_10040 [Betaproteobacteria bacterium]|nr:hypothetical protein [Betaproteobacteria bacterium]